MTSTEAVPVVSDRYRERELTASLLTKDLKPFGDPLDEIDDEMNVVLVSCCVVIADLFAERIIVFPTCFKSHD
jgi:hypothetical protein